MLKHVRAVMVLLGVAALAVAAAVTPAQAATTAKKVTTAITDVGCGTATVSIVLADGVTGVYNARVYANGDEIARVPSTGVAPAVKVLTFDEDSYGGQVDLWVSVIDGPESDYRPRTIAAKVATDCQPPVKPTVAVTAPTCEEPKQAVKVTNPNVLGDVKVRFGRGDAIVLKPGESATDMRTSTVWVFVYDGQGWKPLKLVKYRPPACPTPTTEPTAGPTPTSTAGPTASPTCNPAYTGICLTQPTDCDDIPAADKPVTVAVPGVDPYGLDENDNGIGCEAGVPVVPVSNDGDQAGGLPVTGSTPLAAAGIGLLLLTAGAAGTVLARRRRTRFTA